MSHFTTYAMTKKLLEKEFCTEQWDTLQPRDAGHFCSVCNVHLVDLTETPMSEIVSHHFGQGKCVQLTDSQLAFLSFYKQFRKAAVISSIVISSSLYNGSYAQSTEKPHYHADSCLVTGRAIFEDDQSPSKNVSIYVTAAGKTFETKTDQEGNFAINLPKNCTVLYSNVKKLESKKIKEQNQINLGKNKIHRDKRRMGWI